MARPPRVTRPQILEAAARIFAARGFSGTTLADVAEAVGLTPSALLRRFESKEQLFAAATSGREIPLPPGVAEIANADPYADPREVLRGVAEQVIPYIQSVIGAAIAVQMHQRSHQSTTMVVPFDTGSDDAPPRRGLRILTDYFSRAMNAGTIRPGDPRAFALLFMGQLQSYVFIHHVLNVTPVYPLHDFLDALFDIWERGAFEGGGTRARKKKAAAEDRDRGPAPRRGRGSAVLSARAAKTETARPGRNAGGKNGQRGVAGRRPRNARPRR